MADNCSLAAAVACIHRLVAWLVGNIDFALVAAVAVKDSCTIGYLEVPASEERDCYHTSDCDLVQEEGVVEEDHPYHP